MAMTVSSSLSNRSQHSMKLPKIIILHLWIFNYLSTSLYHAKQNNNNDRTGCLVVSSFAIPPNSVARVQQQSQWRRNLLIKPVSPLFYEVNHKSKNLMTHHRDMQYHRNQKEHQRHESSRSKTRMDGSNYYDAFEGDLPDSNFIDAVDGLSKQTAGRVVADDVATAASVSIGNAKRGLMVLLTLTGGNLANNSDRKLIFAFPSTPIRSVLTLNWIKYKLSQLMKIVWSILVWLNRVVFGMTLIATSPIWLSVILFFKLVRVLTPYDRNRDDDDDDDFWDRRCDLSSFWDLSSLELLHYRPFGYSSRFYTDSNKDPDEMKFLEAMFSIVFGDGNPNPHRDQRRLQIVSNMIRKNQGIVTAEQLAPFCDNIPSVDEISTTRTSNGNSRLIDERYVFPIVTALNGYPQINTGDIIYVFPDLQEDSIAATNITIGSMTESPIITDEAMLLRRVGLSETASNQEILQLVDNNDIWIPRIDRKNRNEIISRLKKSDLAKAPEQGIKGDDILSEQLWDLTFAQSGYQFLALVSWWVIFSVEYKVDFHGLLEVAFNLNGETIPKGSSIESAMITLSSGYANWFFLIYQIRNIWIKYENPKIKERNKRRIAWKRYLDGFQDNTSVNPIYSKLQVAQQYRQSQKTKSID